MRNCVREQAVGICYLILRDVSYSVIALSMSNKRLLKVTLRWTHRGREREAGQNHLVEDNVDKSIRDRSVKRQNTGQSTRQG